MREGPYSEAVKAVDLRCEFKVRALRSQHGACYAYVTISLGWYERKELMVAIKSLTMSLAAVGTLKATMFAAMLCRTRKVLAEITK